MKLFKSLLVAPAALGLLSPLSVSASEVNLNEISNYSDIESKEFANSFSNDDLNKKTLLAGGEGLVDDHSHDGSFSETTTASFTVEGYLGFEDDSDAVVDDAVAAGYSFQVDLNTSFTGEDSLDISLDAGNSVEGIDEFDGNFTSIEPVGLSSDDILMVDGVAYTFPIGEKVTAFVGADTDGSKLFTTACVYGGPGDMLSDCANVNAGITGGQISVGASYDFGNGLTASAGSQTDNDSVWTEESLDSYAFNLAYTADNYGLSLTYSNVESAVALGEDDRFTALNAYYTPDGSLPSISVGYEIGSFTGATADTDESASFMVGLTWDEVGPGSAGVALGHSNTNESAEELYQYEAYYEYPVNDSMTVTPLIYTLDAAGDVDDTTGMMVKTTFTF